MNSRNTTFFMLVVSSRKLGYQQPRVPIIRGFKNGACGFCCIVVLRCMQRVLWLFLLSAFVGITIFQVYDRVRHFYLHPLTVNIVHETASSLPLPKVLLCNKMQVKSSAIAERDFNLLRSLSQLYRENRSIDNETFFRLEEWVKLHAEHFDINPTNYRPDKFRMKHQKNTGNQAQSQKNKRNQLACFFVHDIPLADAAAYALALQPADSERLFSFPYTNMVLQEYAKQTPTLVDAATLARLSQPKQTDFIIGFSCFYKGSQECKIEPVATPSGICYAVSPQGNANVTRPGPENALTILVDVETHEMVPGFVETPGIRVYLQPESAMPTFNSDGLHLSPGQTITIPVNDIYELQRDHSTCGTANLKNFQHEKYRQSACYWEFVFEQIQHICGCEPARSPHTRDFFRVRIIEEEEKDDSDEDSSESSSVEDLEHKHTSTSAPLSDLELANQPPMYGVCNVVQEFTCVRPTLETVNLPKDQLRLLCPNECVETNYGTIMLGSPLDQTEFSSHLPSNWDEIKEGKLRRYQTAYKAIPRDRLESVKGIVRLAEELQHFLANVTDIFDLDRNARVLPRTCSTKPDGFNELGTALSRIHQDERFWAKVAVFAEKVVPTHFDKLIRLLRSRLFMHKIDNPYLEFNRSEIVDEALDALENFTSLVQVPLKIDGIGQMTLKQQKKLVEFLHPRVNRTLECMIKVRVQPDNDPLLRECRDYFDDSFALFQLAVIVRDRVENTDVAEEFEIAVNGLTHAVRAAQWQNPVYLAKMSTLDVDPQQFAQVHRKDGAEGKKLQNLFDVRLLARRILLEDLDLLVEELTVLVNTRARFLEELVLTDYNTTAVQTLADVLLCMEEQRHSLRQLRKHVFLRDEWLSRLTHYIKMTLARTPGAEYDEVNLLYVKVYFAQLKKETVIQRQSFNLFVLLAEIGGTVGLYLGATVVTVLEIIVFFVEDKVRAKRPTEVLMQKQKKQKASIEEQQESQAQQQQQLQNGNIVQKKLSRIKFWDQTAQQQPQTDTSDGEDQHNETSSTLPLNFNGKFGFDGERDQTETRITDRFTPRWAMDDC